MDKHPEKNSGITRWLFVGGLVMIWGTAIFTPVHTATGASESNAPKTKTIHIAFVPKALDNPVFLDAKEAAEKTAVELKVTLDWVGPPTTDINDQIDIMEGLINERVDGIAISCIDPEKLRGTIDKAIRAGIKVATFDSDSPRSRRLFYCGTDNYRAGWVCGEAFCQVVKNKGPVSGQLQILILTGALGADNLNQRIAGFKAATRDRLHLNYIATLACDDDTAKGTELLESFLRNHSDINALFATGGWPFFAQPESLPVFNQWCRGGGVTVTMDTFYPILQFAKKGMIQALVGQDFTRMGDLTVRNLVRAVKGLPLPAQYFDTGLEIVDRLKIDHLLEVKKPWEMK